MRKLVLLAVFHMAAVGCVSQVSGQRALEMMARPFDGPLPTAVGHARSEGIFVEDVYVHGEVHLDPTRARAWFDAQTCRTGSTTVDGVSLNSGVNQSLAPTGRTWRRVSCEDPNPQLGGRWMAMTTDPGPTWVVVHWWTM